MRDSNFVLRVQCDQTNDTLALIPSSKLKGDLPPALVEEHVHWLNLSTKLIEIRPLEHLWEESSENWRIDCASERYRMYKGHETLVDTRSPTWSMVSKCFECLNVNCRAEQRRPREESRNLVITTCPNSASMLQLSVTLPRYGLSFFVNQSGELESCDFKNMVHDEDQCVGTLFGLQSLLVLRPKTNLVEALLPRRVLVPNGEPYCQEIRVDLNHIQIVPIYAEFRDVTLYHTYDVDTELGCLMGNNTLESTRFLAELHAMTSCWHHPDPLTGKTGLKAALCLLQSAACRSIMELKPLDPDSGSSYPRQVQIKYPQIRDEYKEIRTRYYWNHDSDIAHRDEALAGRVATETHGVQPWQTPCPYGSPSNLNATQQSSLQDPTGFLRNVTLHQLFSNRPAPELPTRSTLLREKRITPSDDIRAAMNQLFSLRTELPYQREYLAHLDSGARHVQLESRITYSIAGQNYIEVLKAHFIQCRANYLRSLDILRKSLGPTADPHEQAVEKVGQWPTMTADVLLRYLGSASPIDIPPHWKKCLTLLSLLLLDLQRARRLLRFALDGLKEDFLKELENEGCDGWNAEEHPDWLLIQVSFVGPEPPCLLMPLFVIVRFKETFSFVVPKQKLQWRLCPHVPGKTR